LLLVNGPNIKEENYLYIKTQARKMTLLRVAVVPFSLIHYRIGIEKVF
jgi:hypothetical protein